LIDFPHSKLSSQLRKPIVLRFFWNSRGLPSSPCWPSGHFGGEEIEGSGSVSV